VLVLGVLLLGLTLVIALYNRENSTFASVASIWGLFVGLIGFAVTIYTLFETQRVSRKAQREVQTATVEAQQKMEEAAKQAQEAVREAQEQTRQALERVRSGIREATYWTLLMWMKNLRQATMQRDWPRALLFAEECPAVGERLVRAEGLSATERKSLRERIDDVRLLHTFIRDERMPENANKLVGLDSAQAKALDDLIRVLEALGGRLHHEPTKGATP
jgi:erythromycin esterase-like protein